MTPMAETLKRRLAASPTVGLIGLGYVGLPLAVAFAESGATVIGVDLDVRRVAAVRAGESFIEDVPAEPLARLVRAGRLSASDDIGALSEADAIVICVPTPLGKSKEPDISFIVAATDAVAGIIRRGQLVGLDHLGDMARPLDQLDQVVGEAVVVIDDEDHPLGFPPA